MKLKIVIVFVACISCLMPPAFSIGFLATKALAVGAAKGVAAIAVKGAILKGAALLAKGAAIKGAAALAAKGVLLGSAALLGAKTLKAGALIAGSKLTLPPQYVLQRPYTPEKDSLKPDTSAIDVSQNSSYTAIGVSHKPVVVEIDVQPTTNGSQVDVLNKPSDVDVNVSQNSTDLEIDVLQKPTDLEIYSLQKPIDVEVYNSKESGAEDEDSKPYQVSLPVKESTAPVSDKLPGIMGILQSAIENKTEAVNKFLRSLQRPLFVKQPIIYQIINRPKYYPEPVLNNVAN